jgi:DNA-directed RNA polymerase subunit M/transcription elongation factor TFIIS|tara:strand:+ start:443 stop:799 length:357 start_codon:yes stop_codon:yes gene_type:complete
MEFCENCENMLYIKNDENNNLVKYCKHCNYNKIETEAKCIKISDTIYFEDDLLYNQNINKYLRYDPTLRRIKDSNISCKNSECNIESDKQQILYIKYDEKNMKYFYVCDHCGFIWKEK